MPPEEKIGDRIRALRVDLFRSQQELVDRLSELGYSISRKQIADWESNATQPHLPEQWRGLESALGATRAYLMDGTRPEWSGDSEFIARLKILERELRDRDKRTIIAMVQSTIEENREDLRRATPEAQSLMTDEQRRIAEESLDV